MQIFLFASCCSFCIILAIMFGRRLFNVFRSFGLSQIRVTSTASSNTSRLVIGISGRIDSQLDAAKLVTCMEPSERVHLIRALQVIKPLEETESTQELNGDEFRSLAVLAALPFIGFGIFDNGIMILAGEYFDHTMGILLGTSTMAAAAIGNIVSDFAGITCSQYIELLAMKFGLQPEGMTLAKLKSSRARWAVMLGRTGGLLLGCLIGMIPLLFFDETNTIKQKHSIDDQEMKSEENFVRNWMPIVLR